ncbi:Hexapep domain-containing protein [Rhizoctonia solani AG-1 IA]|uniref:Hexapep domain-containing protein n=1 Tax=Thanatephorus cucumeris (strain AG1-IA) TaxID=983506 RepID=L8WLR2_THACA|nr:Hexapep domain-containing protein [Rhizoctonia solani AG-1 IA]
MSSDELDRSVFEGMIAGRPYLASDPYIQRIAGEQGRKVRELNAEQDDEKREVLLRQLLKCKEDAQVAIVMPFFCEYGFNVIIEGDVFIGTGCTMLDVCPSEIVNRSFAVPKLIPNPFCSNYWRTYTHWPKCADIYPGPPSQARGAQWLEGRGAAIICPGVTIGDGSTVGAGSVVTKDVEPRCLVAGNPARLIKRID